MVYKSVAEVTAALETAYSGPLKKVRGSGNQMYDYIPWNVTLRELTRVFGPFGFDIRVTHSESHPAQGVYTAVVEITARAIDEDGMVISLTRAGQGRSVAQPNKYEREQGLTVATNLATHKTAAAGAASDALSRAAKQLGDAFGLFLYDHEDEEGTSDAAPAATTSTFTPRSGGANENQHKWLSKNGFSDAQIAAMSYEEAKAELDRIFPKKGSGTSRRTQSDAVPF